MRTLLIMFLLISDRALAQSQTAFEPPQAHDVRRYEAGWNKNPFTLKTAPAPVTNAAFTKDLAIGAFYGSLEDPTIVLVNTKTHERMRLKKGQRSSSGITLDEVNLGVSRGESFVEVRASGGETALVRFDEGYLRQLAANAAKNTPPASAPPQPSPAAAAPARSVRVSSSSASPGQQTIAASQMLEPPPVPEALRGILPPSAFTAAAPAENPETARPASPNTPQSTNQASGGQNAILPLVQRRRSITAVQY
ncbi:MAG: hypothetical protein Q8M07_15920 [Prosthecobacter sp.]|nr:hypothetical protein [Prosthecobacter sp.]